jgi:DNA-binding NarL/FixJ family response regulator
VNSRLGPTATLRVLAVEATPLVREGLRKVIEQAAGLRWLGATGSPHAVRGGLPRLHPNVVVLDSALDPRGGLIHDLVTANAELTVVALLNDHHRTATYLRIAQSAGAHGLVRRSTAPETLVAAILRAHYTRWFVDPDLVPVPGTPPEHRPIDSTDTLLSARQRQVLDLIAAGLNSQGIAEKLVVSPETVRTHIKQLLRRLEARDRAHAVSRAYQLGVLSNRRWT